MCIARLAAVKWIAGNRAETVDLTSIVLRQIAF
ncbi:hypothetical protein DEV91_104156 [Phyllobacterium brassicacearum]|nr:hypothetical protein DEV91_104156 [Phyllobacterium brassicacearum]